MAVHGRNLILTADALPTIDGNRAYVTSGQETWHALMPLMAQLSGLLRPAKYIRVLSAPWGIAESLIIDGDKLYFTPGGPETMTIALNKNTGKLIWKTESLNDRPGYVSPILINYSGKRLLINVSANYIFAVDPFAGKIAWKIKHTDIKAEKSFAVWDDAPAIKCVTPLYMTEEFM